MSNIDKSYSYSTLKTYEGIFETNQLYFFKNMGTKTGQLTKHIRVLPFSTQKLIFRRKLIFILFYFFDILYFCTNILFYYF